MDDRQNLIPVNEYVADDEQLARIIFSPSMIFEGAVSPSAFNLVRLKSGTDEDYVSVNRMDYCRPTYEISYTSGAELIKGHCMRPDFLIVTSTLALRCTFIPFEK